MFKKTLSEYVEERREELNLLLKDNKITMVYWTSKMSKIVKNELLKYRKLSRQFLSIVVI